MNSNEESNFSISIGNALTEEMIRNYGVSVNIRQEFIVTTEDKLRLCLHAHLENVEKRKDWWTPAGLFLAILTTLVTTSTFKNIGLKAVEWRALFIFTGVGAFLWLIYTVIQAIRAGSEGIEQIVSELKEGTSEIRGNSD